MLILRANDVIILLIKAKAVIKVDDAHKEHRKRMMTRLKRDGASTFFDHELVEMLLYYAIPRGDTNPAAHRLLNEFNGINGVFKADASALKGIHGVGEKSSMLINIVGELLRRSVIKTEISESYRITNTSQAVTYCKTLFLDKKYECLYAICLDIKGKVIADGYICEGVIDQVPAYSRKVVETALRHTAYTVIIAHNHPGGECSPSREDDEVTEKFRIALEAIGITLNDHIIIGDDGYFSYASTGRMNRESLRYMIEAAQKNNLLQKSPEDFDDKTIE